MTQVGVTPWSLQTKPLVPHPLCSGCGKGEPRWQPWRMGKSKWDRDKRYVGTWLGKSRNKTCQSVGFDSSDSPVLQLYNLAVRRHGRTHTIHTHVHTHTHTHAHSAKITESRRVSHLSLVMFSELYHHFVPGLCLKESSPTPRPRINDAQARLPVTVAFCRQISCVLDQDAWIWVLVLKILPSFIKQSLVH